MSVYFDNNLHTNLTECFPENTTKTQYAILSVAKKSVDRISYCLERSRQRKALLALDDHMLSDIGVSRDEVKNEASKSFWK